MAEPSSAQRRPNRELRLRFVEALARLEPFRRDVLILHAADGLDYPTIAHRLGIGVDEVERLLSAALVEIDRALDDDAAAGA